MCKLSTTVVIFLFVAPSYACVFPDYEELQLDDVQSIWSLLDTNYDEVSSKSAVRRQDVRGIGEAYQVRIDFMPHNSRDGAELYYHLKCSKHYLTGWGCGELEEKRSISFENPADYVEIGDHLSTSTAREVVSFIREELIVAEDGRYKFVEWGEPAVSKNPLDLSRISVLSENEYAVDIELAPGCTRHKVLVREVQCGLDRCGLQIISNEREHYL